MFSNAIFAARLGRRIFFAVALHPGWWAVVCWVLWHFLTSPIVLTTASAIDVSGARTAQVPLVGYTDATYQIEGTLLTRHYVAPLPPAPANDPLTPHVARVSGVTWVAIEGTRVAGLVLTFAAAVLGIVSVLTAPTHVLGRDGRLRPAGRGLGRPTLARQVTRRGTYARIKAGKAGVVADWKAAKGDADRVNKRLRRVGNWRARRWARRHAAERAHGAEYSRPGVVDRWLMRRADPPKDTRVKKTVAKVRERLGTTKAERKAGPADYPGTAGPRLDPTDGPPLSPAQKDRYADRIAGRADAVRDDAAATRERVIADVAAMQNGAEPTEAPAPAPAEVPAAAPAAAVSTNGSAP